MTSAPERAQRSPSGIAALSLLCLFAILLGAVTTQAQQKPTTISIEPKILHTGVKRFGINISGQSFYDSGMMLRNLTFRNPGFEGRIWQIVIQCKFVKGDSCADNDEWSLWPADFVKGASFDFIHGAAKGQKGTIVSSSKPAASAHQGVWVDFGKLSAHPAVGDFFVIRKKAAGDAEGGWWIDTHGGATISTELKDISPKSPGKQALRIEASKPGQSASVTSVFDSYNGRSFVQLNGAFTLTFRAKSLGGTNRIHASVTRLGTKVGNLTYFTRDLQIGPAWQDFKFTVTAHENGTMVGPVHVNFSTEMGSLLLDDVAFTEVAAPTNPTDFRNAVVDRLRELHPGVLRYMDNGTDFGSSLDSLIAVPFARQRAGYSETDPNAADVAIGLHEFLVLCKAVNAEPWFVIPVGMPPDQIRELIEYLAGPASKPYGAKRAALGQSAPWTSVFPVIHLELGNETWNWGSFAGEGIQDPKAYASIVGDTFSVARAAPFFEAAKFDLIMDGWCTVPWYNEQELSVKSHADTIDIAPYTFNNFDNASSTEAIFGPLFAEAEALDSRPTGVVAADAKAAQAGGVKLAVYEVNLGMYQGKVDQKALDNTVPSLGAGLSIANHMLLMLRDDNIQTQAVFALPEYVNGFRNNVNPKANETVQLWGTVVDMGGETNRVRPTFLSEQLANSAIADRMLQTTVSGPNPTWDQADNGNGGIKVTGAHILQSYAFTDGNVCNLILFNLSRDTALPIALAGSLSPSSQGSAKVTLSRLTSAHITDSNELAQHVSITNAPPAALDASKPLSLPPYSMTVLSWPIANAQLKPDSPHAAPMPAQHHTPPQK